MITKTAKNTGDNRVTTDGFNAVEMMLRWWELEAQAVGGISFVEIKCVYIYREKEVENSFLCVNGNNVLVIVTTTMTVIITI